MGLSVSLRSATTTRVSWLPKLPPECTHKEPPHSCGGRRMKQPTERPDKGLSVFQHFSFFEECHSLPVHPDGLPGTAPWTRRVGNQPPTHSAEGGRGDDMGVEESSRLHHYNNRRRILHNERPGIEPADPLFDGCKIHPVISGDGTERRRPESRPEQGAIHRPGGWPRFQGAPPPRFGRAQTFWPLPLPPVWEACSPRQEAGRLNAG